MNGALNHPKIQLILEMKNQMRSGLAQAKKMVVREVDTMKDKLREYKTAAAGTFKDLGRSIASAVPGAGGLMDFLPSGGKAALIAGGIGVITAAGVQATKMAAQWDKSMAKVNVTAQLGRKELRGLSDEIKAIAGRNNVPFEEVPQAFNSILSSGLDLNSSLKLLEPTLKAAKAGFTDVEVVAKAAVSVMASSGINDATRLYDILFATMNKGNAEFADIATYLPKIIPMARNAGISLEEVGGAYAYLTAQGYRAEAAATGLQNVFKSFSDGRTIKGFKAIGVEIFDQEGKMRGLKAVVQDLIKSMDGLTDKQRLLKFDKIGLDQEAASALSSMVQEYAKMDSSIKFVTDSQGEFNKAIEMGATGMDKWDKVTNRLKKTMTDLGEVIYPIVNWFSLGVDTLIDSIGKIGGSIEDGWRWATNQRSRWDEYYDQKQQKARAGYRQSIDAGLGDEKINKYATQQAYKTYASTIGRGGVSMQDVADFALADVKLLEDQKKIFESAIDSRDSRVKKVLKDSGIKDMNDFYRLMEDNSLLGAVNKIQPLLERAQKGSTTTETDKVTGGSKDAMQRAVHGATQQKTTIINFESFIKGNVISENKAIQSMSSEELLRFFKEGMRRVVAGAETGML